MKLKILVLCTLAVAAAVPASSTAVNGADRANAARSCSALRTSVGATMFSQTFGTTQTSRANAFGKCVSTFARTAEQARRAAAAACTASKAGQARKRCIAAKIASTLSQRVSTMKNAAMTCKSLRSSLGATAFNQRFGKNANDRNAFGKCVSSQASNGAESRAQVLRTQLTALNGSGVSGTATLRLKGGTLTVKLDVRGLEPNQSHLAHVHGFATNTQATCPGAAADTNGDKIISFEEGLASFGPVLVELASQQPSASGRLTVTKTITENVQALLPLGDRAIVVHGLTVNGTYVPSLPVACGGIAG